MDMPAVAASGLKHPVHGSVGRFFFPVCIGFAPVVLLLLTWSPAGHLSSQALGLRVMAGPVLMVELFTIITALRSQVLPGFAPRRSPAMAATALLLLIALADAAFVAPHPGSAWMRTILLLIHVLYGVSVAHMCGRLFTARDMVDAWLAGFLVFSILLAVFVAQVPAAAEFDWTYDLPAAIHIRHLGYYAAGVIGLCYGMMAVPGGRVHLIWAIAVATIAFVICFWSGSRGAIAAAVAAISIAFLLFPQFRTIRASGAGVVSLALGAAIAYLLPAPAANMGLNRTVVATVGTQEGGITTGRIEMWRHTYNAFLERPFFGYGEGQMPTVAPFADLAQPHNAPLQFLLAWGIVGAICLLVLIIPFAIRVVRSARSSGGVILAPLMACFVLVIYSGFDGTLYHISPLSMVAACCGLVAHLAVKPQCQVKPHGVRERLASART